MEAVIIPAKRVVHINGVPVQLAVDTIVETAAENVPFLAGYHYAFNVGVPANPPPPSSETFGAQE